MVATLPRYPACLSAANPQVSGSFRTLGVGESVTGEVVGTSVVGTSLVGASLVGSFVIGLRVGVLLGESDGYGYQNRCANHEYNVTAKHKQCMR